jgi:tetratricopeptide (TPR) repeat protein
MKDLEHLVRYLDGELNEVDKKELIEKLKKDPSLSEKVELIKDVDQIMGDKHLSSFEESLKEVENLYFNANIQEKSTFSRRYLATARVAAILLVVVSTLAYFYFTDLRPQSNDKLFSTYYEKMPADFGTRSATSPDDGFMKAIKLYNENKFTEAIVGFENILKTDPSNNAAKLFLGICYTETQKFKEAAALFKSILVQNDTIFEEHASWYLSLCYIKINKPGLARPILDKLISTHSFYMDKASELKKKLT